LTW
jgi:serine/threonine protein kinase